MLQIIRSARRISGRRCFSVGCDKGGVNIDNPDEIENMENNYNELYLQLHQSAAVPTNRMKNVGAHKEYRTVGEYAETVQRSLSHHVANQSKDVELSQQPQAATAVGRIFLGRENLDLLLTAQDKANTLMTVAEVAGVLAAKRTRELIPDSFSSNVKKVSMSVSVSDERCEVLVTATVTTDGAASTEAVMACTVALVTIFDHFKTRNIQQLRIGNISLQM